MIRILAAMVVVSAVVLATQAIAQTPAIYAAQCKRIHKNDIEHFICEKPKLNRLNERVYEEFGLLMVYIDKPGRDQLLIEQSHFRDLIDGCGKKVLESEKTKCLNDELSTRLQQLNDQLLKSVK